MDLSRPKKELANLKQVNWSFSVEEQEEERMKKN